MIQGEMEWEAAHRDLVRLGVARAAHEHALGTALLRAFRAEVWRAMGSATFYEYAERVVGLSPRQTEERLRVAMALEGLPRLSAALAEGRMCFSAARELSRVCVPETEPEWLAAAEGKSVGEIEHLVVGRRPGDRPDDPPRAEARRHRVVLLVSAETFATYREAQAKMRRDGLTEEEGLMLMARAALDEPTDPGRSSYQIRMTLCNACGHATQDAGGRAVAVDATVAEVAQCDAQRVDDVGKASQDVPPATRRLVVRRQHGRCAVPGCRNATFAHVHHVRFDSDGGRNDPESLIVLCAAHHYAVHRGALVIEGAWSSGLDFRHADGSAYSVPANPRAAAVLAEVHSALIGLGFKEREARRIVRELRPHVGADEAAGGTLRRVQLRRQRGSVTSAADRAALHRAADTLPFATSGP